MHTDVEKRNFERKQYFVETSLEHSSGKHQARISDISLDGCYVDSIVRIDETEPVALTLAGSSGPQKFTGEIAYTLPGFGFGIRFTDMTGERTAFLQNVIA